MTRRTSSANASACSILATMHHTAQFGLRLTSSTRSLAWRDRPSGNPRRSHCRRRGRLDTMAHVIKTMADTLPNDPWYAHFASPTWLSARIDWARRASPKTGAGIYTKR